MRAIAYPLSQHSSIRPTLQKLLYWPLKVAQIAGQFPLTLCKKDNEFSFRWTSISMICIYINFSVTLTLVYNYFQNKEEIVKKIMGDLTQTENYASSVMNVFILVSDKSLTIYSILIRKATICFQQKLNRILQEIVNGVSNYSKLLSLNQSSFAAGYLTKPYIRYFEEERKSINKIGLILLLLGLGTTCNSALFHSLGLFNPGTDFFRTLQLIISCVLGICSLIGPRLCYFYYISSIIGQLKVGYAILNGVVKAEEIKARQNVEQGGDDTCSKIDWVLEMHVKLEKVVRKYNQTFGLQLLSCIIIALVLIVGNSFLSCVNMPFNPWFIILVVIPMALLPFLCFLSVCHNAARMTWEAQKTIVRLRNFKIRSNTELELKIILHYTKVISSPPAICPMGFTPINYRTVFSAATMIATYLFILLQFKAGEKGSGPK